MSDHTLYEIIVKNILDLEQQQKVPHSPDQAIYTYIKKILKKPTNIPLLKLEEIASYYQVTVHYLLDEHVQYNESIKKIREILMSLEPKTLDLLLQIIQSFP